MIKLEHVSANYPGSEHPILQDVSFEITRGTFGVIHGVTGSGKTTLFKILTGELLPSSGSVLVSDHELTARKSRCSRNTILERYRQDVGFVFQDFKLLEDKTVEENVGFAVDVVPKYKRHDRVERIGKVIERFGLGNVRRLFPRELSHGEQALVATARAVVREPFVLIADEPAAQLDSQAASDILNILSREQERGMTILLLTARDGFEPKACQSFQMKLGVLEHKSAM